MTLRVTALTLAAAAALTACAADPGDGKSSATRQADVSDVTAIDGCPTDGSNPQCPAGDYRVTCSDGSTEIDTESQVLSDQLCLPKPPPPPAMLVPAADLSTPLVAKGVELTTTYQSYLYGDASCHVFGPYTSVQAMTVDFQIAVNAQGGYTVTSAWFSGGPLRVDLPATGGTSQLVDIDATGITFHGVFDNPNWGYSLCPGSYTATQSKLDATAKW